MYRQRWDHRRGRPRQQPRWCSARAVIVSRGFNMWCKRPYNDAQVRELLVQSLEGRQESLLQAQTLGSKGLKNLAVDVEDYTCQLI